MAWGKKLLKCLLIIFNCILGMAGLGMIVGGILIELQVAHVSNFHTGKFHTPPLMLIVIGTVIIFVTFLGCCGALRENLLFIIIYGVLLLMMIVLELVCAGLAFAYRDSLQDISEKKLKNAIDNYDSYKSEVDSLQQTVGCCGYTSYTDYKRTNLPSSCCGSGEGSCTPASGDLYSTGCLEGLQEYVKKGGLVIGAIAIVICLLEVLGMVLAFFLATAIRKEKKNRKKKEARVIAE